MTDRPDSPRPPSPASPRPDPATWRDQLAAAPLRLLWLTSRVLPRRFAARLAGSVFARIGPLTRKQRHVKRNLSFVKPMAKPAEIDRLARAVWRNFGMVLAEFPHLEAIVQEDLTVAIDPETQSLLDTGDPFILLTAHLGNWEVIGGWLARFGPPLTAVYDRNANPILEMRIQRYRRADIIEFSDKPGSLKALMAAGRARRAIALLQDTRVDSGVPLPLFGVDALTTVSPAKLAHRFDYPLVPAELRREPGQRFHLHLHRPIKVTAAEDERAAAAAATRAYHALLESWISARPGEWLCTKRRWPRDAAPLATIGADAAIDDAKP
ncbi:MAG: lysophospholipid acyltransferase family protein [Pseudomonadales bacterium]